MHTKKVIAGVMALAIIGSTVASTTAGINLGQVKANAATVTDEELGETDFNSGKGLPWHICENATGKLQFDIDNGTYNIKIVNPGGQSNGGVDRWDCQFRHRGLTIEEGHTYRLTYSVKASNSGKMYAKIGNMVDDDQELWHGNGQILDMPTLPTNTDASQVISKLKTAGNKGQMIHYYEGWDKWKQNVIPANQWVTYAYEFKYIGDQNEGVSMDHWKPGNVEGTAELTFHFGGKGQYTPEDCFPAGTTLSFDNIALIDMTDNKTNYVKEDDYVRNKILVNQVGYIKGMDKKATLVVDKNDNTAKTFTVVNAKTGKTVYTGKSTPKGADNDSGDYVHILDFSKFDTVAVDNSNGGAYYIKCGDAKSYNFNIGEATKNSSNSIYSGMLRDSLNYFYLNRSGIAIDSQYITSGDKEKLSRGAGHATVDKAAYVQDKWIDIYDSASQAKTSKTMDVTGGWYDAGDYGKYVVNGGISVWTLQNMYERAKVQGNAAKFADGTMSIPENSNGKPDLLDETKYEMDFLLKMQREDGMVYHKTQDQKWTGLAVRPDDESIYSEDGGYVRIVKPVSTAATLNLAATAAQAYRVWKGIDDTYANRCLEAAKRAYNAAKANPNMLAPMEQAKGAGAYGDTYLDDDFYWAACELYAATGTSSYYSDLKKYQNPNSADDKAFSITTNLTGGENKGSKTSFTWGSTAGLGTLTLALNQKNLTASEVSTIKKSITKAADEYISIENKQGYGIPYEGTEFTDEVNCPGQKFNGYEWGSNSMVVNNAMVMAYAADLNKDNANKYANGVVSAMDYIFGRNAGEYSYVTGYGDHSTKYPHHRFWSGLIDKTLPLAPSGVLSGGPNAGMPDPWIKGAGYKANTLPSQLCYLDHIESWGTNECTINWNSPFAWVVNYLEDYTSTGSSTENPSTGKSISKCDISVTSSGPYSGLPIKAAVTVKDGSKTLKEGTDYTVSYANNTDVGTANVTITGKGSYSGTVKKTFTITTKKISDCTVTLKKTSYAYNGTSLKPSVTVKIGNKTISADNYTVKYENNRRSGTATVTITGKKNLRNSVKKTFTITKRSLSACDVTLEKTSYNYTGKAIKPAVTVKVNGVVVYKGTYTVTYKNNKNKGTATVTIKANSTDSDLKGSVTKTFTIK